MKVPTALFGGIAFALAGGSHHGLNPALIDLEKYMGTWRVLAVMDNPVERHFADATETYSLVSKNRIQVDFRWRQDRLDGPVKTYSFRGRVTSHPSRAVWKMHLFPLFSATYIVIDVAPDYSWAAVAHPSHKFGWVLARDTRLPEETWTRIMSRFASSGYDISKFRRVPQPESTP